MKLERPQFTPVLTGPHRRLRRFRKWRIVEVLLLVLIALFVLWAFHQRVPF